MQLDPHLQPLLLELAHAERLAEAGVPEKKSPEREELERLEAELKRARDAAGSATLAVDDMKNEIERIQQDERKLKARDNDNRKRLETETDPERRRDLQHDRYTVKSRINDLLNELKEAHNEIHALRNNRDVHGARIDELTRQVEVARRAAEAAPDNSEPDPSERAAELRAKIPADALAEYDARKEETDVGAALFNGRSCGGCFIVLPGADRTAINMAAAPHVPPCPNCGTLLVRKAV